MIMKKVINSLFVIIAAMVAFAGCAKQEIDAPATSETKTVQFFANSIETKTEFGTPTDGVYPTLWSAEDKVKILVNLDQLKDTEETVDVECSDDFKSAHFKAKLADPQTESYTFYSISPSTKLLGKTAGKLYVEIKNEQTPLATSVDKEAQLLFAKSKTTEKMPTSVDLNYQHLTAYGKFSLANLADESVLSIKIEAPEDVYLAGKWDYVIADDKLVVRTDKGLNTITLTTSSTTDIWFACAPVDVSNKTLTLTVRTENGDFVKPLNFPADRKFEAGKISKFTVNMAGIEAEGPDEPEQPGETTADYEKVTSAPTDWSGKYLIVYEEGEKAYVFNGKDEANGYVAATISDNKITGADNLDDVAVTIAAMEGGYSIKTANGYIYGKSGENALKFDATSQQLNTISYTDSGVDIISNNTNLRFNSASNQLRFRYYKSGQSAITLYKYAGDNEGGGETPEPEQKYLTVSQSVFNVTADQTSVTFDVNANVGWGLDESEDVETRIVGVSDDELVMTVEVTFPANETAEPKTHIVTFIPEELDENVTVTINQAAKVAVDTNFEAGDYWIIGVEDEISHVMIPFASTSNHAYAPSEVITDNRTFAKYAFTFEAVEGGFNIKASDERYYSTDANYKTFQIKDTPSVWTVSVQNDGTYLITDASTGKTIKYGDSTYTTFGVYASSDTNTGVYPILVKADNPLPVELTSISVSGHKTSFTEGETFEFGGTVTANYNDGSTKDVTNSAVVTEPNMVNGAEVTVSYTEGTVTKTFNYNITVKAASQGGGAYSVIKSVADLSAGTYLLGGNNKDKYADGTMYMWSNASSVSGQKLKTSAVTFTNGNFDADVSSYVHVELIATAKSNVYYIKLGAKYLKGAVKVWSLVDTPVEWTFADMGGTKDGMYFYNEANASYVFINSTTDAIRTYGNSTKYKGIYLFKAN